MRGQPRGHGCGAAVDQLTPRSALPPQAPAPASSRSRPRTGGRWSRRSGSSSSDGAGAVQHGRTRPRGGPSARPAAGALRRPRGAAVRVRAGPGHGHGRRTRTSWCARPPRSAAATWAPSVPRSSAGATACPASCSCGCADEGDRRARHDRLTAVSPLRRSSPAHRARRRAPALGQLGDLARRSRGRRPPGRRPAPRPRPMRNAVTGAPGRLTPCATSEVRSSTMSTTPTLSRASSSPSSRATAVTHSDRAFASLLGMGRPYGGPAAAASALSARTAPGS